MRSFKLVLVASLCVAASSCGPSTPQSPRPISRLVVFVQWDHAGIADRRIQIVETGQEQLTDDNGIAEFVALPGSYTVRAYGINGPGPPPQHVDSVITLVAGETLRLEIVDCLPCVVAN